MKKIFLLATAFAVVAFSSCSDDKKSGDPAAKNYSIKSTYAGWQYFSISEGKIVGTGKAEYTSDELEAGASYTSTESGARATTDDLSWFAETNWDFAIYKYYIRTNSGDDMDGLGGIYQCPSTVAFADIKKVPADAVFEEDEELTYTGMGLPFVSVQSEYWAMRFKQKPDGSGPEMPPVYLKPDGVYIIRSANGQKYYKVEFTQYTHSSDNGLVGFRVLEISK